MRFNAWEPHLEKVYVSFSVSVSNGSFFLEVCMKGKRVFYCELAYVIGILLLALGTAFIAKANFGMSMIVAPDYLIHLKVSKYIPFFSFGMSEYVFQAALLIVLSVVTRKVKKSYFLSFVTAIIYGIVLDLMMKLVFFIPCTGFALRVVFFALGLSICTFGVAFLLHTYLPPEAYELFVKELSERYNISIEKLKTLYDCCSCVLGIVLSLCFFGKFVGVAWGTVICALLNGWLIGMFVRLIEKMFDFKDALPLREKLR